MKIQGLVRIRSITSVLTLVGSDLGLSLTLTKPSGTLCPLAWSGSESSWSEPTKLKTSVLGL